MNKLFNCACAETWADIAPLLLRVALGAIFAYHGYIKVFIMGIPAVSGFLSSVGIPMAGFFAYVVTYTELVGGILLVAGVVTHWIAKLFIVIALVAFFTVHMANGFDVSKGGFEFIMLIFATSVSLMITGGGKYSIDAWCKGKCATDTPPA